MTGCVTVDDNADGGGGGGRDVNMCKYKEYGCSGAKKHKINRSQHCDFNDILHSSIVTY